VPPRGRRTTAAANSRPQAITSLQNSEAPRFRKWLVYGESDAGKTVLAGTAPKALFLTTDIEGTESARALGSTADELRINTFTEFCEAVSWLVYGGGVKEYEWVIPDTITELEELCWQEQLVSSDVRRASKYQPNKADYPLVWAKTKEQLSLLGRAPVNTLFIAHTMRIDRETEDGEDTVTLAMPAMGSRKRGDLSSSICAQHSVVGYMRVAAQEGGKVERQLLTHSGPRWIARDRTTKLGAGMVDPSIPKMLAKINGGAAPTTRTTRRRRAN
jgi:hypothetical protein